MHPVARTVVWVTMALCGAGLALAGPQSESPKAERRKRPPPPPAMRVEKFDVPGHLALPLAESIRMVIGRRADRQSVIVAADPGTGCVLVSGPPKLLEALRAVMGPGPYAPPEPLGAPPPKPAEGQAERRRPRPQPDEVRIVRLRSSSSEWAVKSLREAFVGEGELRLASNEERNAVILKGSPELVDAAEHLLMALDHTEAGGEPAAVHVIPLKYCRAANVAPIVDQFFAPREVEVGFDQRTEVIIVRCDGPTLEQVRSLISRIDVQTGRERPKQPGSPHPERRSERKMPTPTPPEKRGEQVPADQQPAAGPPDEQGAL